MSTYLPGRTRDGGRSLPARAGLAVALAVLVNAVLVVAAGALGLAPGFQALTLLPVAVLSALGAGGAAVVYGLFRRLVSAPDRTFIRVAGVVLILSFVPDVALLTADPAATVPSVVLLMFMHVVVAGASVWALVYWGRRR